MKTLASLVLTAGTLIALAPTAGAQHQHSLPEQFPIVAGYPYQQDIARDPTDVPRKPLPNGARVTITALETEAFIAPKDNETSWSGLGDDVKMRCFAFGGGHPEQDQTPRVPGPFLRLRVGNTVTIRLENLAPAGGEVHSIDLHAVVGKKGGAAVLTAQPGSAAEFTFTPQNPGLYVYHCAGNGSPHAIAHHMNNGMFGLALVEPDAGGPGLFRQRTAEATELYVFQQDMYLGQHHAHSGTESSTETLDFDEGHMLSSAVPTYSVFNGRIGALIDKPLRARLGRNAVIYMGSAGGHVSSPHVIGEIWDWVYGLGDIQSRPASDVQTALVPSAGSAVLIMDGGQLVRTNPGTGDVNVLVDHASPYFRLGALGLMMVQ